GTYQGNACGFRLASLLKLSHTKSHAEKKTTVLHYMVRSMAAKETAATAAAAAAAAAKDVVAISSPAGTLADSSGVVAWPGGAPPGCRGGGSSSGTGEQRTTLVARQGKGAGATGSRGAALTGGAAGAVGTGAGGDGGSGGGTGSGTRGGRGGGSGGGSKRTKVLTRVDMLDLEAELGSVRAASKVPVGEILLDVRQARRGLKQAEDELARAVAEEEEKVKARVEGKAQQTKTKGNVGAQTEAEMEMENRTTGGEKGTSDGGEKEKKLSSGGPSNGADGAGVRKLGVFVEEARIRLSSIEQRASECVGLCKGLGEFFGEGADEAQSGHIFRTLVQFLDLLEEAKKAEGAC
ncbi:unnamed protein product, partial [Laminaria digitata]